jgi:long-chain fatty acid transport protein
MKTFRTRAALAALALLASSTTASATNGHLLHGSGAVNAALGGAGTARAFEVIGVGINPATLVGMRDLMALSVELFSPTRHLSSEVEEGAFGPDFGPPTTLSGRTKSDRPLSILPAIGLAYTFKESCISTALIFQGVAGFGVDYDESPLFADGSGRSGAPAFNPDANPILTPQAPNGYGFGHIFSEYKLMTLKLAAAIPVADTVDIGVALIPALSELQVDPFPATNPVDANNDDYPSYPNTGFDKAWGFGFQLGAVWRPLDVLRLGLSYSSPIWFEEFKWGVVDEGVSRRKVSFRQDYPAILGGGFSWDALEGTTLLSDVRYVFYETTKGFDKEGFAADGSVRGFGWKDIWVFGLGIQQRVVDELNFRIGYNYNTSPIPERLAFFNVAAPAVPQHRVTLGLGWEPNESWLVNFTYYHAFEEGITGPYQSAQGPVPGTRVNSEMSEDSWTLQINYYM